MSFDANYPSHPWAGIDKNQRNIFYPILRDTFERQRVYGQFVSTVFNLGDISAPQMTITSLLQPFANFDPIGLRTMWMDSSYMDSFARTITFSRYGGKMAYHKYDDLITYWQQNGAKGLKRLVDSGLGGMMTRTLDTLARNSFLGNCATGTGFGLFGNDSGTNFGSIGAGEVLSTSILQDVHLGMQNRDLPYTANPTGNWGDIVCIASPGAIRALRNETGNLGTNAFIPVQLYNDPRVILRKEKFTYQNVRFIETNDATLWNCGTITAQSAIDEALVAGDGAQAPSTAVDGAYYVGQSGRKNYVPVVDATGFAVNQIVSIHTSRTSAYGVTNGVDFRDGTKEDRRIVAISGNDLVLDRPLMINRNVDLGGSVYGYVTKAKHIATALFIGGNDGVVLGVGRPPEIHQPRPVDDFDSMYRISWDAYIGYRVFEPIVFEAWFGAGDTRVKGPKEAA